MGDYAEKGMLEKMVSWIWREGTDSNCPTVLVVLVDHSVRHRQLDAFVHV